MKTQYTPVEYNGWTNYETWNVALWCDNEETLYRKKQAFLSRSVTPIFGSDVQCFVVCHMHGKTPDLKRTEMHLVNWAEIARDWEVERQEIQGISAP